jgi:hypothetical protein
MGGVPAATLEASERRRAVEVAGPRDTGRRRFTLAVVVGLVLSTAMYVWVLWGPWEAHSPIRKTAYEDNFYDLQARAMLHGHLWLRPGAIGIEAFTHGGHQYTYFGIFPSVLRMPVLIFTSSLDSKLTPSSMLLAWVVTAVFTGLLLWRVRVLLRGAAVIGMAEAVSFGILAATITAGSVLLYLGNTPYVFSEDLSWSVALTIASMFGLVGVLERPSWSRVVGCGLLILAANLDRVTTGWACAGAALLVAAWFRLGRGGPGGRRWWLPMLFAGAVPLAAGFAVNWLKFGVPFGLPVTHQVWTSVNAYRRRFLAANHNSEVGPEFIPSNLLAYLRPDGLRFTATFPFITLPAAPAKALFGVLFDRRYRTASMPASMLSLFLLSCWGTFAAFRRRPVGKAGLMRIPVFATACAGAALMLWGYIANRYLADFVPFLAVASAVGMADIWRRLDHRAWHARSLGFATVAVVSAFTIAASVGIAVSPEEEWNATQLLSFVQAQKTAGDVTGHALRASVVPGGELPAWGPADKLVVVGNCDGLYISDGEDYSTVPFQQYQRTTWMAVERGPRFQHSFRVTFGRAVTGAKEAVPLVSVGGASISVLTTPSHGEDRVAFELLNARYGGGGLAVLEKPGTSHVVTVVTDTAKHVSEVTLDGKVYLSRPLAPTGPIVAHDTAATVGSPSAPVSVVDTTPSSPPALCRSLLAA